MTKKYKLVVMDVDGTLTDGKIYISRDGEFMKAFNVKDGYAINNILKANNIKSAIITGRESKIVSERARELNIDYVFQNQADKLKCLNSLISTINSKYDGCIGMDNIVYIGDDLNDLDCINAVGFSACPKDAVYSVVQAVDYVSPYNGGEGAVRDILEKLVSSEE